MTEPQTTSTAPLLDARLRELYCGNNEEGSAMVELGFTLPIILLIMTGIFAFSIALYQKLALAEGVSAGARTLATERGKHDPCSDTATALLAAAPTLNKNTMKLTFVLNGVTVQNAIAASSASCPGSGTTGTNSNMVVGKSASVTASYPCTISVYNMSFSSCTLGSSVAENIQ